MLNNVCSYDMIPFYCYLHLFTFFLFAFPPSISAIIDKISPLSYMRVTYQLHAIRS
jgi:hypothetical protein